MTISITFGETNLIEDLEISLDERQVKRYLKHSKSDNIKHQIDSKIRATTPLLKPRGVYMIKEASSLKRKFELPDPVTASEFIAFAVSTIGEKLEKKADQLMKSGKFSDGLILDALGSCAVSELSRKLAQMIYNQAKSSGLNTTRVFEPGGGSSHWAVENQKFIFDHLDTSKIGVSLTPSYIMIPKKSISFILGLGKEIRQSKDLFSCEGCPRMDCTYRYIPED